MNTVADPLLQFAASHLRGQVRRHFLVQVCQSLCEGNPRRAERRFGWGPDTIVKGLKELAPSQPQDTPKPKERRGRPRSEVKNPQLASDIRSIVVTIQVSRKIGSDDVSYL